MHVRIIISSRSSANAIQGHGSCVYAGWPDSGVYTNIGYWHAEELSVLCLLCELAFGIVYITGALLS